MKPKNLKRLLALGLASVMTMSLFTGCGNNAEESQVSAGKESQSTQVVESTPASEEPVVIEWLAYDTYAQPNPESELVKMIEEKFNVDFEFWFIDDQKWSEMLGARLSSGEMPDVMKIKNTADIPTLVKQGVLAELTDEMLAMMPTFMSNVSKFDLDGNALVNMEYEGKLYGWKVPSANGIYPTVLVWRKDWLEAVGIDSIPSTIDEMEAALYAFRNNDPDGDGSKDTYGMSNTVMNAVFGAYGAIPLKEFRGTGTQNLFYTEKDGKIVFACTQPEMKDALTKLQQWYKDGIIDPEFVTGENTAGYWATSQAFENSKVGVTGMAMANHWMPPLKEGTKGGACYEGFIALNPDTVWGETIDIGSAIEGPQGASGTHCWGSFGTAGFGITTQCAADERKVEAVFALIEAYASDDEYAELAKYGIEGKHYSKSEDGIYTRLEPYAKNTEYLAEGVGVFQVSSFNDFDIDYTQGTYAFYEQYKTPGYVDILVPQTEGQSQYLTDLKTFALDAYIKIITGEESIDYFDTFVKEFNRLGGQQIIDEINAAIK